VGNRPQATDDLNLVRDGGLVAQNPLCWGAWATNSSLFTAWTEMFGGSPIRFVGHITGVDTLVASYGHLLLVPRIREQWGAIGAILKAEKKRDAIGTNVARGIFIDRDDTRALDLLGSSPNDHYALGEYLEPCDRAC